MYNCKNGAIKTRRWMPPLFSAAYAPLSVAGNEDIPHPVEMAERLSRPSVRSVFSTPFIWCVCNARCSSTQIDITFFYWKNGYKARWEYLCHVLLNGWLHQASSGWNISEVDLECSVRNGWWKLSHAESGLAQRAMRICLHHPSLHEALFGQHSVLRIYFK